MTTSSPSTSGIPTFRALRSLLPFAPSKQAISFSTKSPVVSSPRTFVNFGSMRKSLHFQRERSSSSIDAAPIRATEPSSSQDLSVGETSFRRSMSLSTLDSTRVSPANADQAIEPNLSRPDIRFQHVDDTAIPENFQLRQTPSADTFIAQDLSTILEADTSKDIPSSSISSFSRLSSCPSHASNQQWSTSQRPCARDDRDTAAQTSFLTSSPSSLQNEVSESLSSQDPTVQQFLGPNTPIASSRFCDDKNVAGTKNEPSLDLSSLDPDLAALLSPNRLTNSQNIPRPLKESLSVSSVPDTNSFPLGKQSLKTAATKTSPQPRSRLPKPRSTSARLPQPSTVSSNAQQRHTLSTAPAIYPFPLTPQPHSSTTTTSQRNHLSVDTFYPPKLTSTPSPTAIAFPPTRPRLPASFGPGSASPVPGSRKVTPTYPSSPGHTSTPDELGPPAFSSSHSASRPRHPSTPSSLARRADHSRPNRPSEGSLDIPSFKSFPRQGTRAEVARHSSLQSCGGISRRSPSPPFSSDLTSQKGPTTPSPYAVQRGHSYAPASASASTYSLTVTTDLHTLSRQADGNQDGEGDGTASRGRVGTLTSSTLFARRRLAHDRRLDLEQGQGLELERHGRRLRERSSSVSAHDYPRRLRSHHVFAESGIHTDSAATAGGMWTLRSSHRRTADEERDESCFGDSGVVGPRSASSLSGRLRGNVRRLGYGHGHRHGYTTDWLNPKTVKAFRAAGLLGPDSDGFRDEGSPTELYPRSHFPQHHRRDSRWPQSEFWGTPQPMKPGDRPPSPFKVETESPTCTYNRSSSAGASPRRDTPRSISTAPTSVSGSGSARAFGSGSGSGTGMAASAEFERERDLDDVRELKDRHATETAVLLSALADSQQAAKSLRKENGELRARLGNLQAVEVENERLRRDVDELKRRVNELRSQWAEEETPPVIGPQQRPWTREYFGSRLSYRKDPKEDYFEGDHRVPPICLDGMDANFIESPQKIRQPSLVEEPRTPEGDDDENTFALDLANPAASSTPAASSSKAKLRHLRRFSTTSSVQLPVFPANMTMLLHDEDYDNVGGSAAGGGVGSNDSRFGTSFISDTGNFASSVHIPDRLTCEKELSAETSLMSNAINLSMTSTVSAHSLSLKPEHETHLNDLKSLDLGQADDW